MSYAERLREVESQRQTPTESEEVAFNRLVGYAVASMREKRGWFQSQLADVLGITQSALSRMEKGEVRWTVWDLMQVGRALECRWQSLIPTI